MPRKKKKSLFKDILTEEEIQKEEDKKEKRKKKEITYNKKLKKNRAKKGIKKSNDYIDNEKLYNLVCEYHDLKKEINNEEILKRFNKVEEIIILDVYKIINKYINNHNFRGYENCVKEDIKGYALEKILKSKPWNKFDPKKSNAIFSFLTRTVFFLFVQYVKKHYVYKNDKQHVLHDMIVEYNAKWCKKGIQFNFGDLVEKE